MKVIGDEFRTVIEVRLYRNLLPIMRISIFFYSERNEEPWRVLKREVT